MTGLSEADIQYALSRQFAYAYLRKTPGPGLSTVHAIFS